MARLAIETRVLHEAKREHLNVLPITWKSQSGALHFDTKFVRTSEAGGGNFVSRGKGVGSVSGSSRSSASIYFIALGPTIVETSCTFPPPEWAEETEEPIVRSKAADKKNRKNVESGKAQKDQRVAEVRALAAQKARADQDAAEKMAQEEQQQKAAALKLKVAADELDRLLSQIPPSRVVTAQEQRQRLINRMQNLPAGVVDPWFNGLNHATANNGPSKQQLLLNVLTVYPPLWNMNTFNAKRSTTLSNRLMRMTAADLSVWKKILIAATGDDHDTTSVALICVDQDSLFDGEQFKTNEAQQLFQRIAAIPPSSIEELATAMNNGKSTAAIFVASLRSVFPNEQFDADVFRRAVETIKGRSRTEK